MIPSDIVFQQLHLADPYGATEEALRVTVSGSLAGRPVGNSELSDALRRLEARRFATSTRNDDSDLIWSLTTEGRTEAQRRFR